MAPLFPSHHHLARRPTVNDPFDPSLHGAVQDVLIKNTRLSRRSAPVALFVPSRLRIPKLADANTLDCDAGIIPLDKNSTGAIEHYFIVSSSMGPSVQEVTDALEFEFLAHPYTPLAANQLSFAIRIPSADKWRRLNKNFQKGAVTGYIWDRQTFAESTGADRLNGSNLLSVSEPPARRLSLMCWCGGEGAESSPKRGKFMTQTLVFRSLYWVAEKK
ncbi:hypothetical protein C8R45DRAFT_926920 [Mycena sanguinolenta]|nr:hypothetical protein C8R45DRAFT_926920 [Mycena sanguinolenta]